MEVAAGKVKSKPVQTANGIADVVQWTLATAASNHLTVLRIFGHGVDPAFPLQYKPGGSLRTFSLLGLGYAARPAYSTMLGSRMSDSTL